jgi:thymidine kinase
MGHLKGVHSIRTKLGTSLAYGSTAMNSSKTSNAADDREIAKIAGLNVRCFSSIINAERDGLNSMRSNEGKPISAKSVLYGLEIIEEIERLNKILLGHQPQFVGEKYVEGNHLLFDRENAEHRRLYDPKTDFAEEDYFYGRPISVSVVDETQLLCLDSKGTKEMIEVMDYCRDKNILMVLAILLENAKQEEFGNANEIYRKVDRPIYCSSRCKFGNEEEPCGNGATHTIKLWRYESLSSEMKEVLKDLPRVSWWTKKDVFVEGQHVVSPYFSPMVQIELDKSIPDEEKPFVYLPGCNDEIRKYGSPFKEEFFAAYNAIQQGKDPREVINNEHLLEAIVERQLEEGWVKNESGLLIPQHYQKEDLGIYSPIEKD